MPSTHSIPAELSQDELEALYVWIDEARLDLAADAPEFAEDCIERAQRVLSAH